MALSDLPQSTLGALKTAGSYLADLATPTVRLGVTGLSRAGKTVFITALVRNLIASERMTFFGPAAEGRLLRAYLEPQPDDDVPRFAYEAHLAALARDPPDWPESTRRISQLRVTIEHRPKGLIRSRLGSNRLHVDIVDYPGEWLVDLGLMAQSYRAWSAQAVAAASTPRRADSAGPFLAFLAARRGTEAADEQVAITGADLFTQYLRRARGEAGAGSNADPTLGPGRFLLPGDLQGSPLLTFFPLPGATGDGSAKGTLAALLERRFEAYKLRVVKPFWRDHFARLDRQIVLVDALSAIDAGGPALVELEAALAAILTAFRPGAPAWLPLVMPRRIDRILFAATKADHLHHTSHDRLEAIMAETTRRASERAAFAGAEVRALALAALRSTKEAQMTRGGEQLACIVGTPLPGERIGAEVFDGRRPAAIFPGDLPSDWVQATAGTPEGSTEGSTEGSGSVALRAVRFRPQRIAPDGPTGRPAPWPHIRLDRALDFLLGDLLA